MLIDETTNFYLSFIYLFIFKILINISIQIIRIIFLYFQTDEKFSLDFQRYVDVDLLAKSKRWSSLNICILIWPVFKEEIVRRKSSRGISSRVAAVVSVEITVSLDLTRNSVSFLRPAWYFHKFPRPETDVQTRIRFVKIYLPNIKHNFAFILIFQRYKYIFISLFCALDFNIN